MNEYAERLKPLYHFAEKILFPVILILFPLLKVNQGIDLTDTAYSLGNYAFFGENTVLWTLLTFLSNVLGFFFTKLPFGGTMLGMKVYSSLLISAMALNTDLEDALREVSKSLKSAFCRSGRKCRLSLPFLQSFPQLECAGVHP